MIFDHAFTKADAVIFLVALGHDILRCGCYIAGRLCPCCLCLETLTEAALRACFSREEVRALYDALLAEEHAP